MITLVTLLALVVLQLGSRADTAQASAGVVRAAGHHDVTNHHRAWRQLTRKERYVMAHPRLIRAARIAANQRGDRYQWGAEGPNRFDCSGLIYYAYRKAGFRHMPRTAQAQYRFVRHVRKSQLRRGDLLFFFSHGHVYHVGVFLFWRNGRRVFVHAPNPGGRVRLAVPWTDRWRAGTLRRAPRNHHRHGHN
ncbi:MAG: C40 family peptidase [Actinomycetota bacterium]|nr:C40 family peptidase [Actinomycetota bacterium]